jgi:ubiquinone/menaquinone biosynthesis C-methylase UbiE
MDIPSSLQGHFERAAPIYDDIRNTDASVMDAIVPYFPCDDAPLYVADVGCATGRYARLLATRLGEIARFLCCDCSRAMLTICQERVNQDGLSKHFQCCLASATNLPFSDSRINVVICLNAVHHFDLDLFIVEAVRVLRPRGLLIIYTRTPQQNARTVWGQYFPRFAERETRLHGTDRLEKAIVRIPGLRLECIEELTHVRTESVESLLRKAQNFHYSTFAFYSAQEFRLALAQFQKSLSDAFMKGFVEHTAENTLVIARRA